MNGSPHTKVGPPHLDWYLEQYQRADILREHRDQVLEEDILKGDAADSNEILDRQAPPPSA